MLQVHGSVDWVCLHFVAAKGHPGGESRPDPLVLVVLRHQRHYKCPFIIICFYYNHRDGRVARGHSCNDGPRTSHAIPDYYIHSL